jgi:hypothetical protein
MSDGIRSGVNWMRLEDSPRTRAQRRDQLGLGETRHTDEQRMTTREHRKQGLLDHAFLSEDHLGDRLLDF